MSQPTSRGPMPADLHTRWNAAVRAHDPGESEAQRLQAEQAAKEPTFSGFVRRCLLRHHQPLSLLAASATVEPTRVAAFQQGQGLLTSDEIDRLLTALGVELVGTSRS